MTHKRVLIYILTDIDVRKRMIILVSLKDVKENVIHLKTKKQIPNKFFSYFT